MTEFSFTVSPIETTKRLDSSLVINKKLQNLRFSEKVPDGGVPIAYIGLPTIGPWNVTIKYFSGAPANSTSILETPIEVDEPIYVKAGHILLTDISVEGSQQEDVPLFYKHILKDADNSPVTFADIISIVDSTNQPILSKEWKLIEDDDMYVLYHNLLHTIDPNRFENNVYRVSYKDQKGDIYNRLLETVPAWEKLQDASSSSPPDGKSYYIVVEQDRMSVTVNKEPSDGKFWVKGDYKKVLAPFKQKFWDRKSNWNLKIYNGMTYHTVGTVCYRYELPEFDHNEVIKELPGIGTNGSPVTVIDKNTVQSRYAPLHLESPYFLELIILDKNGVAIRGYTTNPTYSGSREIGGAKVTFIDVSSYTGFSVDPESGIISLPESINETDTVRLFGFYKENYFIFTDLELNPTLNRLVLNRITHIYLRPYANVTYNTTFSAPCLCYVIADRDGTIVDYSRDNTTYADTDLAGYTNWDAFINSFPEKIEIGEVSLNQSASKNDITVLDARRRGGGIKDLDDVSWLADQYPELLWSLDMAALDGRPYPGAGSILVNLPVTTLLDEKYSSDDIKYVINKYKAFGVYPLLEYYGDRPVITKCYIREVLDGYSLYMEWRGIEDADYYKIVQYQDDIAVEINTTTSSFVYTVLLDTVNNQFAVVPVKNSTDGIASKKAIVALPVGD